MNKRILLIMALWTSLLTVKSATADYDIVPLPKSISISKGKAFTLNSNTPIVYTGNDPQMQLNANFLAEYISELTGLKLGVESNNVKKISPVILMIDHKIQGKESYRMTVTNKQITIAGSTPAGVFYGIQTLRKSLPVIDNPENINIPAVVINDAPRFVHRGMMLDCCRHFFPISFIKKFIDIMALHNMNVFHWHLSDDQGWRIEIKHYPRLTEIGSKRSGTVVGHNSYLDDSIPYGGYYTQDEAREIVKYAGQRNIMVIPEIEMPGHMKAALAAYPELGCTGGPYEVGHNWGVYWDVLCLGNDKIYPLLQDIIDELVDVFPSKYIHIGGDETPTKRWESCPKCQALAKAQGLDCKHLQGYFTNRMEMYINSKGRSIIGWDEILGGKINKSATVMSWRGVGPGNIAAKLGHDVIMAPMDYSYFDFYQAKETKYEPQSIGGYLPVSKVYEMDPAPDSLSAESKSHILGAQANLWTEYIPYTNQVEYMILPRMAALAEVLWTPVANKNYDAFVKRMTHLATIYDSYGYIYAPHIWPERYKENRFEW